VSNSDHVLIFLDRADICGDHANTDSGRVAMP
jgi:hypothetical protein